MKKRIFVTATFEAFHCWLEAPAEVSFLQNDHRHLFHVRAEWEVNHNDRELEFFIMKRKLDNYLETNFANQKWHYSCEDFAQKILERFDCCRVEVSEDGENGAVVEVE